MPRPPVFRELTEIWAFFIAKPWGTGGTIILQNIHIKRNNKKPMGGLGSHRSVATQLPFAIPKKHLKEPKYYHLRTKTLYSD